jgi:chromosome segregation protein
MKLLKITIEGFKSFADRVEIPVGTGITAVVGPNGCGKSNIVDAINWGLGARSFELVRSEKAMTEVIFRGNGKVDAARFAEVRMLFSNEAASADEPRLAIDAPEVEVVRRIEEDGHSSYLINKSSSLLREVRSLFAGTGLGPGTSLVVEQGTVASLVTGSPAELRRAIDEASGIAGYKDKIQIALDRLGLVSERIAQAVQIKAEDEKRKSSLIQLAARARRFEELQIQVQKRRHELALIAWASLVKAMRDVDERIAQTSAELEILEKKEGLARSSNEELQGRLKETELMSMKSEERLKGTKERLRLLTEGLEASDKELAAIESADALKRADLKTAQERLKSVRDEQARLNADFSSVMGTADRVRQKLGLERERKGTTGAKDFTTEIQGLVSEARGKLAGLLEKGSEDPLVVARQQLLEIEQTLAMALDLLTHAHSIVSAEKRLSALEATESSVEQRVQQLTKDLADLETRRHQMEGQISQRKEEVAQAQEDRARVQAELKEDKDRVDELVKAIDRSWKARGHEQEECSRQRRALDQVRLDRARLEGELTGAQARCAELGIALQPGAADSFTLPNNPESLHDELKELEEKLQSFGKVDPTAPEQLRDLEEKIRVQEAQLTDLDAAKAKLAKFIDGTRNRCRLLVTEKLTSIRSHFNDLFRSLFNGGKADIALVPSREESATPGQRDSTHAQTKLDPLDAGVQLRVRLPGKDITQISLLSGGEKSLAALAFVIATIRAGSARICVLDEVDAALDAANTVRFVHLLTAMKREMQIIVITHNQNTMMVADRLLGITMDMQNKPGVTQILEMNLLGKDPAAGAARSPMTATRQIQGT